MSPPDLKQKESESEGRKERERETEKSKKEGGRATFLAARDICTAMRARGPADLLVDSVT